MIRVSSSTISLHQLEEQEIANEKSKTTVSLVFAVIVAALSQFNVGYNTGVMNPPEQVVFPGHSTAAWSFAVAAFAIGGPFGAATAGSLADSRGRRGAIMINIWTFILGGILQSLAPNMYIIMLSRFIIGFASGSSSVIVPVYLGEVSPPHLKGAIGTITQFALVIGILIADFVAFPFATEDGWRFLFAVTVLAAVIQLLCSPFILESPRWLLGQNNDSIDARRIIKKLRGYDAVEEVEKEVTSIVDANKAQMSEDGEQVTLLGMFSNPRTSVLIISALVLQMAQQLCGINAVFYYSTGFFEGIIENPLLGTTIVGAVNVVATYFALLIMDSAGRRTLVLWSSGGMFVCCVLIVMALYGFFDNIMALIAVNIYVIFFEIGLGPIPWLIVPEMFETKYVATAMSAACQMNWFCNFIVGLVFPFLLKYLGDFSFVPFAIVLLITFFFALFVLPETLGKTPEKLQEELMKKDIEKYKFAMEEVRQMRAEDTSYGT